MVQTELQLKYESIQYGVILSCAERIASFLSAEGIAYIYTILVLQLNNVRVLWFHFEKKSTGAKWF